MNAQGNTLVVHVVSARYLHLRANRPVDLYVSLAISGKGPWKSKVATNAVRADPADLQQQRQLETRWDEHCEFQLNDTDAKLVIHVNHKTLLGTTETLGELVFPLDGMARFQPAAWFRLGAKTTWDQQEHGQIQLGYQFSNRIGNSISNMSLNKIEKEKKFDRLRRKMQQLGRAKKATAADNSSDVQSLASVSLAGLGAAGASGCSRRSSLSSVASGALAFSSPSPNTMLQLDEQQQHQQLHHQQEPKNASKDREDTPSMHSFTTAQHNNITNDVKSSFADVVVPNARSARRGGATTAQRHSSGDGGGDGRTPAIAAVAASAGALLLRPPPPATTKESASGGSGEFDRASIGASSVASSTTATRAATLALSEPIGPPQPPQPRNLKAMVRQKAEQLLHYGAKKHQHQQQQPQLTIDDFDGTTMAHHRSRRGSIASSSGFASLGSGQLGALNEHTSPEHLLNVIRHLRKELLKREERIRDLEQYTDNLVTKVMVSSPELLQQSSSSSSSTRPSTTLRR